ncbi:exo-beta-N-acetylmuramidase NamZ family protein [Desulforegula conservatrix]|uniref:exo-beta-N-acetylmuramidase NamZ family protein n=1 Tax=Desulforegula conservatrix TaxID=153026 RepID=UPI0003FE6A93|nr:DUF1343 domain-containing protein [Desulforegula conservatrix]
MIKTGLNKFIEGGHPWIEGKRLGLLCNPASVDENFIHARYLVNERFPGQLKAIFSPQHGFFAEKQDNMIESGDTTLHDFGIPVFSLYGETRKPTERMMEFIDVLIVDLLDVGTRVYTFIYTISYCMEAAREFGKKVIILDRPNPVGGIKVEGNCLDTEYSSFVGRYPIPMRHGLTVGELAYFINKEFGIGCELEVIKMEGWKRGMIYSDTGLPWVPPSPNLPTPHSALVYPGQVIWEGTNVSEGRGTTSPFEQFGAPFIETGAIISGLPKDKRAGIVLREVGFEPTSNKWAGQLCWGFFIHVTDHMNYDSYETSLRLLQEIIRNYTGVFHWKIEAYEYEFEKLAIDLILGDINLRKSIENLEDIDAIIKSWQPRLKNYINKASLFHLY